MTEAARLRLEEETLLALLRRADALGVAYMAVELEEWGYLEAKAEVLETLEEMCADAHEWFVTYRRAFGIPGPLAYTDGQGGVILREASPHDHEEEDMERHTVEYTFDGEKLSFVAGEHADLTLYRTDEDTLFVHLDARKVGDHSVLEVGAYPRGLSEHDIWCMWPQLLEAQSR